MPCPRAEKRRLIVTRRVDVPAARLTHRRRGPRHQGSRPWTFAGTGDSAVVGRLLSYAESARAHRALAAFLAISRRRAAERLFALACPPFRPPFWPAATAFGSFPDSCSSTSPVASLAIRTALAAGSLGSFLGRFGMSLV